MSDPVTARPAICLNMIVRNEAHVVREALDSVALHNRTEALTLVQGHGDYIWVIDADDTVVGTPDFTQLSAGIYMLRRRLGSNVCRRFALFRDESGPCGWLRSMGADQPWYVPIIQATKTSTKPTPGARWTLALVETVTEVVGADVNHYLTGLLW